MAINRVGNRRETDDNLPPRIEFDLAPEVLHNRRLRIVDVPVGNGWAVCSGCGAEIPPGVVHSCGA